MIIRAFPLSGRWASALALGVALAGFAGCVSTDEYKRLDTAFQQARMQLADEEQTKAELRHEIDSLKAELAARDTISGGVDALTKENALLRQKLADLQKKYEELQAFANTIQLPSNVSDALAKLAEQYPDLLEYDAKLGRIRFKSDLTFDLGSTEVKPRAREALRTLAGILNLAEIAKNQIRIVGHTDDVPIRQNGATTLNPNNWFLSTNRAHAVREVLQEDGVIDTRIQPAGDGPTQPIAENAPGHKGNEKNRRVEIFILPTTVPANAVSASESDSKSVVSGPRPAAPPPVRRNTPRTPRTTPGSTAPTTPAPAPSVPLPATLPGGVG